MSRSANSANGARQSKKEGSKKPIHPKLIQYYWAQFAYLGFSWVNATENLLFVGKWGF